MFKTTVIALIAATSMVSVAAPAFADTEGSFFNDNSQDANSHFYTQSLVARLQDQGVNATTVEYWGGLVRAFVTDADGHQSMQFFTPDTLTQVVL